MQFDFRQPFGRQESRLGQTVQGSPPARLAQGPGQEDRNHRLERVEALELGFDPPEGPPEGTEETSQKASSKVGIVRVLECSSPRVLEIRAARTDRHDSRT